ncbi:hypothetical protein SCLARK_00406 [Spiroplasma clarkii]|nr:hypothetical protein SCLARK_00406 [Spiroplasma clarkii]
MVHQRARNLPTKGIVVEWLFTDDTIAFGADFARVLLEDGTDFIVKSNYNGVVVKTIRLNSPIKNGSILANVLVGEKEIAKYKNRNFLKEHVPPQINEFMPEDFKVSETNGFNDLDAETSGALVSGEISEPQPALLPKVEGETMPSQSLDRFAQMRANIRDSIKNAPQIKNETPISQEELLKMDKAAIAKDEGAIFSKKDGVGPSKFRQLVNARKEALLQENNFREVQEEPELNAMSKTDEKGRPLIMRNIIAARMEKLNDAGGDVNVLSNETNDSTKIGGQSEMINNNINDQNKAQTDFQSEPQDIGSTTYRGTVLPSVNPNQLMGAIQNKSNKTYAEAKLTNLYDPTKRNSIIAKGNERNIINQRRQAVEAGLLDGSEPKNPDLAFWKGNLPKEFAQVVPYQTESGDIKYVSYDQTPQGKIELAEWIKNNQNKKPQQYQNQAVTPQTTPNYNFQPQSSPLDVTQEWDLHNATPKVLQQDLNQKLNQQEVQLKAVAGKEVANEAIELLKKQIADLQSSLEKQNQLNAATQRLNAAPTFGGNYAGGTDTFSQLFQYMMMQNIMQSMPMNKNSSEDVKDVIRREIDNFKNELRPGNQHYHNSPNQCYCQQSQPYNNFPPHEHQFHQPNYPGFDPHTTQQFGAQKKNYANQDWNQMQAVNFEKPQTETTGYLDFEGSDANKIVKREKVNKNRNAAVKSMILSQNYIPPLTISTEIDMSSILKLKHVLKKTQTELKFPSIAFIAKAISLTLGEYPKLNSSYDPESNEVIIKNTTILV